jgi:tetratricopeptide (TPR) repeat protein
MIIHKYLTPIVATTSLIFIASAHGAGDTAADFRAELLDLQHGWAQANYVAESKRDRRSAFEAVVEQAAALSARYPTEVAAVAWEGIVLSTYAGEVSALGAMKYAKAALAKLEQAEALDAQALNGGIYASLGALYSKVPGGFIGFGDDDTARDYFQKALAVDSDNIDNNFFYGEFLVKQGDYARALEVLNRALNSAPNPDRPVFDEGRREEIRELINEASNP